MGFERWTERARQVVVLAQEEAKGLRHGYVGTEHLLLGLLREGEGVAAKALAEFGLRDHEIRVLVAERVGEGTKEPNGKLPFTPRAMKVCEMALREALSMGHNYIGTEHVLLGLVRENEGVGVAVLRDKEIDSEAVRNAVIRIVSGPRGPSMEERLREYEVCKKRGHENDGVTLATNPPKYRCKHCGTVFWTEVIERESGAPVTPASTASGPREEKE